ncbi:MAG: hypothetical protein MHM6MM_001049 [Cercozoa sp. M6MM]
MEFSPEALFPELAGSLGLQPGIVAASILALGAGTPVAFKLFLEYRKFLRRKSLLRSLGLRLFLQQHRRDRRETPLATDQASTSTATEESKGSPGLKEEQKRDLQYALRQAALDTVRFGRMDGILRAEPLEGYAVLSALCAIVNFFRCPPKAPLTVATALLLLKETEKAADANCIHSADKIVALTRLLCRRVGDDCELSASSDDLPSNLSRFQAMRPSQATLIRTKDAICVVLDSQRSDDYSSRVFEVCDVLNPQESMWVHSADEVIWLIKLTFRPLQGSAAAATNSSFVHLSSRKTAKSSSFELVTDASDRAEDSDVVNEDFMTVAQACIRASTVAVSSSARSSGDQKSGQ